MQYDTPAGVISKCRDEGAVVEGQPKGEKQKTYRLSSR